MQQQVTNAIEHMVSLIEPALMGVEQGGDQQELRELQVFLQKLLIEVMRLSERDPGLEAAAADLYGAISAIVRDNGEGAAPHVRKLRLLREATSRFRERIATAHPNELGTKIMWRHHELLCA